VRQRLLAQPALGAQPAHVLGPAARQTVLCAEARVIEKSLRPPRCYLK
jgi:hypothetical protein